LAFTYDVHGLVQVSSTVPLPQLAFFGRPGLVPDTDTISVRVEDRIVIGKRARRVGKNFWYDPETDELTYTPPGLLRSFRASLRVGQDSAIRLTRSYYNVTLTFQTRLNLYSLLTAVLSLRLLSKERKLLYGACVSMRGRGAFLPAFSDIGKTTTVLNLVRSGSVACLSDDATIVSPSGKAFSLPTAVRPKGGARTSAPARAVGGLLEHFRVLYPFGMLLPSAPRSPYDYEAAVDPSLITESSAVSSMLFLEWGDRGSREIDLRTALNKLWALNLFEPVWMSNPLVAAYGYARPDLRLGDLVSKEAEIMQRFTESAGRYFVLTSEGKDFSELVLAHLREGPKASSAL
jgi:hypothetical protein